MSPGGWCRLLLDFAAQNATGLCARSDAGKPSWRANKVIGGQGERRSEVKEEGRRSRPGGHERSRSPWPPMTGPAMRKKAAQASAHTEIRND